MSLVPECDVGRALLRKHGTLAVAESCTGGMLGQRISSVSGSSRYFLGGIIAYDNTVKVRELGVSEAVLAAHGAVSRPVAQRMAEGVRLRFGADIAMATTGLAGPTGGSGHKPVGLVYIALACASGCFVEECMFAGLRQDIRRQACDTALLMAIRCLNTQGVDDG